MARGSTIVVTVSVREGRNVVSELTGLEREYEV